VDEVLRLLKNIGTFEGVPETQLKWLIEKGTLREFDPGDKIINKGSAIDSMLVILEGAMSLRFEQKGQYREIMRIEKDGITGSLPYSRATNARGFGIAGEKTMVLSLDKKHFPEMIQLHHEMVEALVHFMTSRVREFSRIQYHDEKLISLGKLSAGLAHELNNPASAMVRSAQALKKRLRAVPEKFKRVISMRLSPEQVDAVNDILFAKVREDAADHALSLVEKTALVDALTDWLEEHGVDEGYDIAETLADCGFTEDDLKAILAAVSGDYLPPVIEWLDNVLNTEKLVQEIEDASLRIAGLINSIKSYSHMDQAPDKQPCNIRKGVSSTLTMLNHKLKAKNVQVIVGIPDDLPDINAFVGELNQVWTNLIDNAIDAMQQNGVLEIAAESAGESARVKIIDNGSGIPEEIQSQVFDPFFTTKSVGEGTGMGLDIVQKIIQNHKGDIRFDSRPGRTEFRITLPIN
jgi:signal transduction histidine kinase